MNYQIIRANADTVDEACEELEKEVRAFVKDKPAKYPQTTGNAYVVPLSNGTFTALQAVVW